MSDRAREEEIERRRRRLPRELRNDPAFAATSRNWTEWFRDEHNLRRQALYTRAPTPPSGRWSPPPHTLRRDAPPVPRRQMRIGSPPPPPAPVKTEPELTEEEQLEAIRLDSLRTMAEDEERRWALVLAQVAEEQQAAAEAQQTAVLEPQEQWYEDMEVELPPPPPLPQGMIPQRWVFNGHDWEVAQEAQEPPAAVPQRGGPPAHLWQEPPYIILEDDEEEDKKKK